jgi:DNA-binding CsgD family transcriptional regulator
VVGREEELETLKTALGDPDCGGVALIGGAGFGKTCLAAQAVGLAVVHGMTYAWLRATKSAAAIPFAALAPLFVELNLREVVDGAFMEARLSFTGAALRSDPEAAATAASQFDAIGANLFAAEALSLESRLASNAGLRRRASTADARAKRAFQKCEGATPLWIPRSSEGSHLSEREHEVALLASLNLTSREIANRLFVSVRTVDNHLQQVYVKLGVKRRTDLAAHL